MQNIWETKTFEIQGDKKVVFTALLLASTPLFFTNRCRYVREMPLFENILWIQEERKVNKNCWTSLKVMKQYQH
jgi:hypothetical protein